MTDIENKTKVLTAVFLNAIVDELAKARKMFPEGRHLLAALNEEQGEVANALLERDYLTDPLAEPKDHDLHVWEECVQTATMALRLAVEGDPSFKYEPPDYMVFIGDQPSANDPSVN